MVWLLLMAASMYSSRLHGMRMLTATFFWCALACQG